MRYGKISYPRSWSWWGITLKLGVGVMLGMVCQDSETGKHLAHRWCLINVNIPPVTPCAMLLLSPKISSWTLASTSLIPETSLTHGPQISQTQWFSDHCSFYSTTEFLVCVRLCGRHWKCTKTVQRALASWSLQAVGNTDISHTN